MGFCDCDVDYQLYFFGYTIKQTPVRASDGGWCLVTGGSGGLGLEIARALLAKDFRKVVLASRSSERLAAARESLLSEFPGAEVVAMAVDLSKEGGVGDLLARLAEKGILDNIDVLVNNAGNCWQWRCICPFVYCRGGLVISSKKLYERPCNVRVSAGFGR